MKQETKKLIKKFKDKERRLKNIDNEKKRGRDYYKENRERILKRQKEYDLKHKAKRKAYNKKHYRKKKNET